MSAHVTTEDAAAFVVAFGILAAGLLGYAWHLWRLGRRAGARSNQKGK